VWNFLKKRYKILILNKYIEIITTGKSIAHYKSLGYDCKYGSKILVKQKDLSKNSDKEIEVQCDYCGEVYTTTMRTICRNANIIDKHACNNCKYIKQKEVFLEKYGCKSPLSADSVRDKINKTVKEKYGVDNIFQSHELQEKQKKTVKEKYGCSNVFQNLEVKEKIKQTCQKKYGVDNPNKSDIISEKIKQTCIDKYGLESPFGNKDVQEKIKQTMLSRYGVLKPLQNNEIHKNQQNTLYNHYGVISPLQNKQLMDKALQHGQATNLLRYGCKSVMGNTEISKRAIHNSMLSLSKNGNVNSSINQRYICDLYNGSLNVLFEPYFVDAYFNNEKIYLEYNGTGHNLQVQFGNMTQKEFDIHEIIRYKKLKSFGLKYIKFIHNSKKLPNDKILFDYKDIAFQILLTTDNNWISFDLDTNMIKTKYKSIMYLNDKENVINNLITL
jgi:hypothetical protein